MSKIRRGLPAGADRGSDSGTAKHRIGTAYKCTCSTSCSARLAGR